MEYISQIHSLKKRMTDYLYHDGLAIPIIRIGRGSSKFFSNLIRSYIKNYSVVNVTARGPKINLLIWVIYQISNEYKTSDMSLFWDMNRLCLTVYVYNMDPVPIQVFEEDPNYSYIKVGKNSDEDTMRRLINKTDETYIIAAGSSCITACQLLFYSYTVGFVSTKFDVIKTYDHGGNEKAGMKVYITRNFPVNAVCDMPPEEELPEESL